MGIARTLRCKSCRILHMGIIGPLFLIVFGILLFVFSRKLGKAANGYWTRFFGRETHFSKAYQLSFVVVGIAFLVFSILSLAGIIKL
jgi:hypothetical protein